MSTNDISREVNEPAEENETSNHHHLHGVDAFQRLPNVHLTRPRAQYGIKNGFVPDLAGMPSTAAQAGMMMMMMPPPPPLNLKQEAEDEKGQNSERSGFDSFQEEPCEDREDMEQSKRTNNDNNNSNNAKKRSRPAVGENIKRPETPFMNSPSAAADVLMSLCGDGDGGLFAAAAPRQTNRRRRNSNSETTCTGQIVPLNLKCPRRKRTSLCKNIRRSSSGSSLEEDNGGENGAVVLHGITSNRQDNSLTTTTTTNPRIHDNNDNKASSMEQKQKRKHKHNSSGNNNGKNKRQKVHRPWSLVEVEALVAGVKRCGRGQWADIKSLSDESISGALLQRSAVDLKDKWRNVMRTALSPVLYKKREATEIPEKMLEDIRSLATPKEKETLATNNAANTTAAVSAVMANTISATATATTTTTTATTIRSPSTSGDGNNSNTNEDGADHTFVTNNIKAESSQQKNTALVERNTIVSAKSDEKKYVQGQRRSKHHSPWTLEESQALVDGVRLCGCRWTAIKKRDEADAIEKKTFKRLGRRTAMDMKDKWRNLLQLANLPTQSRRKRETPMSLLVDVLELEKKFGDTRRRGRRTVATAATNNMKMTSSHKHHPPQTATAVATVVN